MARVLLSADTETAVEDLIEIDPVSSQAKLVGDKLIEG
jgi:hypothetical protein